jgi:hypothetical protein
MTSFRDVLVIGSERSVQRILHALVLRCSDQDVPGVHVRRVQGQREQLCDVQRVHQKVPDDAGWSWGWARPNTPIFGLWMWKCYWLSFPVNFVIVWMGSNLNRSSLYSLGIVLSCIQLKAWKSSYRFHVYSVGLSSYSSLEVVKSSKSLQLILILQPVKVWVWNCPNILSRCNSKVISIDYSRWV